MAITARRRWTATAMAAAARTRVRTGSQTPHDLEHVETLPERAEVVVLHDLHGQVRHRDAVGEGHVALDEFALDFGYDGREVDREGVAVSGGERVEEGCVGGAVGRVPGRLVGGGAYEGVQGLAQQRVHAHLEGARVDLPVQGAGDLGDDDFLDGGVRGEGDMEAVYRSALPSSWSAQYAMALAGTRRATSAMSTADRMVRTSPGNAGAGPGASGVAAVGGVDRPTARHPCLPYSGHLTSII